MQFPTPRLQRFLRLMLLLFLQPRAQSFWSPLSGLDTALFDLMSIPCITQQFQKNAYHNDKCVISDPCVNTVPTWLPGSLSFRGKAGVQRTQSFARVWDTPTFSTQNPPKGCRAGLPLCMPVSLSQ
jgi:hypothetical protein